MGYDYPGKQSKHMHRWKLLMKLCGLLNQRWISFVCLRVFSSSAMLVTNEKCFQCGTHVEALWNRYIDKGYVKSLVNWVCLMVNDDYLVHSIMRTSAFSSDIALQLRIFTHGTFAVFPNWIIFNTITELVLLFRISIITFFYPNRACSCFLGKIKERRNDI